MFILFIIKFNIQWNERVEKWAKQFLDQHRPPLISFHAKYKNGTSVDLSSTSINHLEGIGHNVDQNTGVIWRRTVNYTKIKLLQMILFILYCPCFIYNYYQKQIHEYKNIFNIFTTHMRTTFGVGPSIYDFII